MVAVLTKNSDVFYESYSTSVGRDHTRTDRWIASRQDLVEVLRDLRERRLPASRQIETAEEKFERLANKWRKETSFQSSIHAIALHPAYQEIIGMGCDAVPLMLQALEHGPEHWFWALRSITGVSPIKEADRGNMEAMAQAWVCWGKDKRYL